LVDNKIVLKERDLTKGSIAKALVGLSIPIIFANALQTVYQLTDTVWVGRVGVDALASVSLSFPIIFFGIAIGSGISVAGSIFVAQFKGANNQRKINHISGQGMILSLVISLTLSSIGYLFAPFLVRLLGGTGDVYQQALIYLRISFIGAVFTFTYMSFQSLMMGLGRVKIPMVIVLTTVLLNFFLDPIFIMGWGKIPAFGVAGAAIASIFSQFLASITGFIILFRGGHGIKIGFKDLIPDSKLMIKMLKLGFPASIEQSTRALGLVVITILVGSFGEQALATYGLGARMLSFVIIPALGLSMATATIVGQNIGAGKIARVKKTIKIGQIIGFVSLSLIGVLMFVFSESIARFIIPTDPETIKTSAFFLRVMSPVFGFIGIQMVIYGAFRGSGNTMMAMILSLVTFWVLRFPIAYLLSYHTSLGVIGIWYAFPIGDFIATFIGIAMLLREKWMDKKLTVEEKLDSLANREVVIESGIID